MTIKIKYLNLNIVLTLLISSLIVLIIHLPAMAKDRLGFPESHKHFLGASSYRAIFGFDASSIAQGFTPPETVTGRPPRIGSNIQVNDPQEFPFGRSETTIAASGNGHFMVLGWNDAEGFCGEPFPIPLPCDTDTPGFSGFGYSSDGGKTFIDGGAPPIGDRIGFGPGPSGVSLSGEFITLGDPSMDVGGYGNDTFYFANLAEFRDQFHVFFGPDPTAGVVVHIGEFTRGKNFSWNDAVLLQSPNYPNDFLDKEHIAADKRDNSANVYVTVTNYIGIGSNPFIGFGQIEAYSSPDGGETWSRSIIQPDETISVPDVGIVNQGSEPVVGPDGTVYVAWERGWLFPTFGETVTPEIRVAKSVDNGATWIPAASGGDPAGTLVSKICSGALFPPVGYNRLTTNDFPRISVAQSGPDRGRVYVTWQDCRIANGGTQEEVSVPGIPDLGDFDTDIYLSFSDDQGETWSEPVLVAGGGDGKIQFWPTVSIQPSGNVDITYYESVETDLDDANDQECVVFGAGRIPPPIRISPVSSMVDLYYIQSTNGGASFHPPIRVSNVTTNWCDTISDFAPNFGDYNTAASAGNRLFATWADGRYGVPDVFFSKIHTAGKSE